MLLAIGFQGGILIVAVALGYVLGFQFWEAISWSAAPVAFGILISIPMTLAVILLVETAPGPFERMRKDLELVIGLFKNCTLLDVLWLSILAGVGEEALFRGVLQPFRGQYTGPVASILIVGAVFGLIHAISLMYAVYAGIVGVGLGALYYWQGNLLAPMTVHAAYDFFALAYGLRLFPLIARKD